MFRKFEIPLKKELKICVPQLHCLDYTRINRFSVIFILLVLVVMDRVKRSHSGFSTAPILPQFMAVGDENSY